MEVTGLAVGTLGLASLFKTCLDLYDAFDCGSRHGVEYEILAVKVEVEKLRLALWGESMGFVRDANSDSTMRIVISDQLDPRLRDQRIVKAVADVLHCMENLFRDTEKMKRRYGLQQDAALRDPRIEALSGRALMSTFKQAYERFKLSAKTRQATADLNTMAKWAVRDKKKFQRFVDELRGFNDSLSSLFPDTDAANRAEIVAGIQAGTNVEELDLIEKAVEDEYRDMADAASARITLISQYPVDDNLSAFDDDTTTVGAHYEEKLEKLVKQLDKTLELKCVGALSISMWNTYGNHYSAFQTWDGIRGDDYLFQKERDMELVRHPFLSWSKFIAVVVAVNIDIRSRFVLWNREKERRGQESRCRRVWQNRPRGKRLCFSSSALFLNLLVRPQDILKANIPAPDPSPDTPPNSTIGPRPTCPDPPRPPCTPLHHYPKSPSPTSSNASNAFRDTEHTRGAYPAKKKPRI